MLGGTKRSILIDSGSEISAIKKKCIENLGKENFKKIKPLNITGIGSGSFKIEEEVHVELIKWKIKFQFKVINDDFPIETDLIIGADFLNSYMCRVNFEEKFLQTGEIKIFFEENENKLSKIENNEQVKQDY